MWTWGRNDSQGGGGFGSTPIADAGQLGATRMEGASLTAAAPVTSEHTYLAAAAGRYHSAAVTTTGRLATWGLNDFGQLGRPGISADGKPCAGGGSCHDGQVSLVPDLKGPTGDVSTVVAVAAGRYHTIAATATGAVYTTGLNFCGNPEVRSELCLLQDLALETWCRALASGDVCVFAAAG